MASRCARVRYMIHALYFKHLLLFCGSCTALDGSAYRPHPGRAGDFDLLADMFGELVSSG